MKAEHSWQFSHAVPVTPRSGGYQESADELVRAHRALVRKIAWHVHGRANRLHEIEDLVQVGLMALIEAARAYEDRGFNFRTYATMRIRGAMIDHLRREMPVGRAAVAASRKLAAARAELEQLHHRSPTSREMAQILDLPAAEYLSLEQLAAQAAPLSIEDIDDDAHGLADLRENGPGHGVEAGDMLATLAGALSRLTAREQLVLQLYFHEELNLLEIGEVLDVSAARVCQIKSAALAKVRQMISEATD